jgi:hypothetical protein
VWVQSVLAQTSFSWTFALSEYEISDRRHLFQDTYNERKLNSSGVDQPVTLRETRKRSADTSSRKGGTVSQTYETMICFPSRSINTLSTERSASLSCGPRSRKNPSVVVSCLKSFPFSVSRSRTGKMARTLSSEPYLVPARNSVPSRARSSRFPFPLSHLANPVIKVCQSQVRSLCSQQTVNTNWWWSSGREMRVTHVQQLPNLLSGEFRNRFLFSFSFAIGGPLQGTTTVPCGLH